jgi:hypothetical protein
MCLETFFFHSNGRTYRQPMPRDYVPEALEAAEVARMAADFATQTAVSTT